MARRLRKLKTTRRKKNRARTTANNDNTVEHEAVKPTKDAPIEPPKDAKPLSNTDTTENTKYYTAKEAAEMLNISAKQVAAFIQDKSLANAFKKSGRWQIPGSDIQTLKNKLQEPTE